MNLIKSFAILIALSGVFCSAQTSPAAANSKPTPMPQGPGYTLTVDQPLSSISLKAPISVTMTVKNISGEEILWRAYRGKDSEYKGFRFLLKKNGQEVETTFLHRKLTGRQRQDDPSDVMSGSSIVFPWEAEKKFLMTIDLKRLYEITEPGQYTLDISRPEEDNKTVVRANTVTLDIVP